jgi:hypothetical protein
MSEQPSESTVLNALYRLPRGKVLTLHGTTIFLNRAGRYIVEGSPPCTATQAAYEVRRRASHHPRRFL